MQVTDTSVATSQTQQAKTSQTAKTDATKTSGKESANTVPRSDVLLSSRAKKVEAFADEFFRGGGINTIDIEALKDRAFEYGLITKDEYARLKGNEVDTSNQVATPSVTSEKVADQVQSFIDRLNKLNQDKAEEDRQDISGLTGKLEKAVNILKNPEQAMQQDDFMEQIRDALAGLKDLINAESFSSLGIEDRVTLTNAASALSITESLAPRKLSNEKLNRYISHSLS